MGYKYRSTRNCLLSRFGRGSVDDVDQYIRITTGQAYIDMQPRTLPGINKKKIKSILEELGVRMYAFVTKNNACANNQTTFNDWHNKQCEWFIKSVKKKAKKKISYGKAQKIINISFKYIYCLDDASKYKNKFKYCHMTLDRYTYSEGFYKKEIWKQFKKPRPSIVAWSKLDYKEYVAVQDGIRNNLDMKIEIDGKIAKMTPFEAEFIIFDEYSKKSKISPLNHRTYSS